MLPIHSRITSVNQDVPSLQAVIEDEVNRTQQIPENFSETDSQQLPDSMAATDNNDGTDMGLQPSGSALGSSEFVIRQRTSRANIGADGVHDRPGTSFDDQVISSLQSGLYLFHLYIHQSQSMSLAVVQAY